MSDNSKIIAALLVGAAVGAAIGYFIASDNKEEAVNTIEDTITNGKDKLLRHIEKGRQAVNHVTDEIEKLLNTKETTS